jgi:DNA-binding transcriptional regulator YiaG
VQRTFSSETSAPSKLVEWRADAIALAALEPVFHNAVSRGQASPRQHWRPGHTRPLTQDAAALGQEHGGRTAPVPLIPNPASLGWRSTSSFDSIKGLRPGIQRKASTKDDNRCNWLVMTPAQSRAGRALLDWSQEELAKASHLGLSTIRDFEKGRRVPTHNNLRAIQHCFESAGIEFIPENGGGVGVRLKARSS